MKAIIIAAKELTDQIRDRRTITASILLPAIIVPLLLFLITGNSDDDDLNVPMKIAITEKEESIKNIISTRFKDTIFINFESSKNPVNSGEADIQIEKSISERNTPVIIILFDPVRRNSRLSNIRINKLLDSSLTGAGLNTQDPEIKSSTIRNDIENKTILTLSLILPVFLIVFAASATMSAAIDISAGEKERSTIEMLLSSDVSHVSIIAGKAAASSIIGLISVASLTAGLSICSSVSPEITGGVPLIKFCGIQNLILIFIFTLTAVIFFAAAGVAIGFFARSVKEGTILILPVIVLSSALSSGLVAGDPFSAGFYVNFVPVLNIALIIRSIVFNHLILSQFIIAAAINLGCTFVLFMIGCALLQKENVIFRS